MISQHILQLTKDQDFLAVSLFSVIGLFVSLPIAPADDARGFLMPIFRDREQFEFQRFDGLYFWMRDGADQFLCKVSDKALQFLNGLDGGDGNLVATFVRHRVRIEMVAEKKYDESHGKNGLILVLSKDVTRLSE